MRILGSSFLLLALAFTIDAQPTSSFFDHFPGPALHPRWVALTSGAGSVRVQDSVAELFSPSGADASAMYHHLPIDKTKSQLWVFALSNHSGGTPQWWLTLANSLSPPAAGAYASFDPNLRVRVSMVQASSTTKGILVNYWNLQHQRRQWSGSVNAWVSGSSVANTPAMADDYYLVGFEVDGLNGRWRILTWGRRSGTPGTFTVFQGLQLVSLTDWVPWSSLERTDNLWLILGEPFSDVQPGGIRLDWVLYDDGPRQEAWVNASDGGPYHIRHWYGYENADGIVQTFVPQDRTTIAVNVGAGGAWDSSRVKDQYVVKDGATYYLFYNSSQSIGLATATDPDGPWVKEPTNPIFTGIPNSEESSVFDAGVILDQGETDPNRIWKMLYTGFGPDGKFRMFYATAPTARGPWTRQGKVLDAGNPGALDELGVARARPIWENNQWYVFHSVRKAGQNGNWNVSFSTGTSFTNLVKSNQPLVPTVPALQTLTANLAGRLVTVPDSSAFEADGAVLLRQSASPGAGFAVSRIRKIASPTQIELYHGLDGFQASGPADIVLASSDQKNNEVAEVRKGGASWYLYVTNFFGGSESTGLLQASALTGPYQWVTAATPPVSKALWGATRSNENMTFVHLPVDIGSGVPDVTPPSITDVAATNVIPSSALISWVTDEFSDSQVEYGETDTYGSQSSLDPTLVVNHSVTLNGLLAGTLYHYRVLSRDRAGNLAASQDFTFLTPSPPPPPPPDTTPPQVSLTAPADGATVTGTAVQLTADATDDVGVTEVEFLEAGNLLGTATSAPYSFSWDTTTVANGSYSLTARARDAAGNVTVSAVVTVTVANNYALDFDGVDDLATAASQPPPIPLSISMWFMPATLGEGNAGHLFSIRDDADNNPNLHLRLFKGNKLRLLVIFDNAGQTSPGVWETPANSVVMNTLQHVVVAYDGSSPANNPVIYLNGVAQAVTRIAAPVGTFRSDPATWLIGNNPATAGTFKGWLDEVRIYNRLLSQAEALLHFNNGQIHAGQPEPGLVAGWHFDENTGILAMDYSGNGNHAVLVNGPRWIRP
jgi:hypothetical protein